MRLDGSRLSKSTSGQQAIERLPVQGRERRLEERAFIAALNEIPAHKAPGTDRPDSEMLRGSCRPESGLIPLFSTGEGKYIPFCQSGTS